MLAALSVPTFLYEGSQEDQCAFEVSPRQTGFNLTFVLINFCCQLDITYSRLGRGNTVKDLSRSDWPVVTSVMILTDDGCWEGPVPSITSSTILWTRKSAEHEPGNQSAIFLDGFRCRFLLEFLTRFPSMIVCENVNWNYTLTGCDNVKWNCTLQ